MEVVNESLSNISDAQNSQNYVQLHESKAFDQPDSAAGTNSTVSFSSFPSRGTMLPWGVHKERPNLPQLTLDTDMRPGEFVMCSLFIEFTVQAEKKIEFVMSEPLVSIYTFFIAQ